jgi:hypothetical protein
MQATLLFTAIVLVGALVAVTAAAAPATELAKATFAVHCYDVGAGALDGKPGVVSVERGWRGFREVDRVTFDPQQVSLGQLEGWLKAADTYVSTLDATLPDTTGKQNLQ